MARHFANQDDAPRSTVPAPRPQVQRQQAQRVDAGISTRRVSDRTAFYNLEATGKPGRLVEYNDTKNIFENPEMKETDDYINGRFG